MQYKEQELKKGIKLHTIKTDKFKTNLIAVFLTTKLTRKNVTKNALISTILRRGTRNMITQEDISKQMEEMYGASFDCGLDKTGDNQVIKFYVETINDNFIPQPGEELLKTGIEKILEIAFNPYVENDGFKSEYLGQEKNNIKQRIDGKIDNKARYAIDRCIEEMYKDEAFGLYKFGFKEDLEQINSQDLYNYYKELINTCKIDIFVSGKIDDEIKKIIEENENIKNLKEREPNYIIPKIEQKENKSENIVMESMEVTQGKLILGLDVSLNDDEQKYTTLIYNSLLGGDANSKMFQNVREKAHLAYVASSSYLRYKNNIFVNCGIEISNYEKALELIRKQIEDMKNGDFADEELENSKQGIISSIKTIDDEQDTEIMYYLGQELTKSKTSLEQYMEKIQNVTRQGVIDVAKNVNINTIYFLKD